MQPHVSKCKDQVFYDRSRFSRQPFNVFSKMVKPDLLFNKIWRPHFLLSFFPAIQIQIQNPPHSTIGSLWSSFGFLPSSSLFITSLFCGRSSWADNLNGSCVRQQIPFKMAASVAGEFLASSAVKAIWEIKWIASFLRISCGHHQECSDLWLNSFLGSVLAAV